MATSTANPAPMASPEAIALGFNDLPNTAMPSRDALLGEYGMLGDDPNSQALLDTFFTGSEGSVSATPSNNGSDGAPSEAAGAGNGEAGTPTPASPTPAPAGDPATISSQPVTPPPAAAATPAPAIADEAALRIQALEAQIAALTAASVPVAPAAPSAPAVQVGPELPAPAYNLDIPAPVFDAIFNEDAATSKAGLTHLINQVLTIAHMNVQKEMTTYIPAVLHAREEAAERVNASNSLIQDYYGAFPEHNADPQIRLMVSQEAAALAQATGAGWSEKMRNAVGARVNVRVAAMRAAGLLPQPGVQPAVPQPVVPTVPSPAAPAAFVDQGVRPAAASAADFITATFRG